MIFIKPKEHENCQRCPLFKKGIPVNDRLPLDRHRWSHLAVIGEMPGKREVEEGFPFLGQSGKVLWNLFQSHGTGPDDVMVTNSIRCGLRGGEKPDESMMLKAQELCIDLVRHNLREAKARVALCTGKWPWRAMTGFDGIEKYRGTVIPRDDVDPFHTTCTLHPAALLHSDSKKIFIELLHADVGKALKLARRELDVWDPPVCDAMDLDNLIYWLDHVRKSKVPVACDVETDGIDALACGLLTIGMATEDPYRAFSIPWRPTFPEQYTDQEWSKIHKRILGILDDPKMHVVFHNKTFDVPVLQRHFETEIDAVREDTLLMHHALYPRLPHDLQAVGSHFLPLEPWKTDFESSSDAFFKMINKEDDDEQVEALARKHLNELLWYNAADAAATISIYHKMQKELDVLGVRKVYEHDRRKCDISIDWYWNGIGIDLEERNRLAKDLVSRINAFVIELRGLCGLPKAGTYDDMIAEVGQRLLVVRKERNDLRAEKRKCIKEQRPFEQDELLEKLELRAKATEKELHKARKTPVAETFNPNSNDQMAIALIQGRGITPDKVTKGGEKGDVKISVSKDSLWNHRDDEFVNVLFQYREVAQLYKTYVKNLPEKIGEDGRLHPVWKNHSTPSGRYGTKPAVQNWTKDMQKMMIATKGHKFVGADYAALELRIQALFAGQQDLIDAFNNDEDRHSLHAEWFFGDLFRNADPDLQKILRGRGKNVTFGKIYGAGPETLYEQIREKRPDVRTPAEHRQLKKEVRHMSAVLDNAYPNQGKWSQWANMQANAQYRVYTPRLGRVRKWPMGNITPTEPPNHLIQGSAADIMDEATFRLVEALQARGWYQTRVWIVLQIHDALYLECEEELAEQVRDLLQECMTTEWTFRSPITNQDHTIRLPAEAKIGDRINEVG